MSTPWQPFDLARPFYMSPGSPGEPGQKKTVASFLGNDGDLTWWVAPGHVPVAVADLDEDLSSLTHFTWAGDEAGWESGKVSMR